MTGAEYTRSALEGRNSRRDAAIVIDNVVYDVTGFLEEHPGGAEALLTCAGRDASQCFRDVGHSDEALARRELLRIGEVVAAERLPVLPRRREDAPGAGPVPSMASAAAACAPPLALAVAATLLYMYLFT